MSRRARIAVTGAAVAAACVFLSPATPAAPPARACRSAVSFGPIPTWARTGFSEQVPRMPHVLGRSREIVALIFGYPLHAPPGRNRGNKILWVSHRPSRAGADLRIAAQRMEGARRVGPQVHRIVRYGPGPSLVDLPGRGCWRMTLRWSGRTDNLDLQYR